MKKGRGIKGMGLEHCNNPKPNLPSQATSRTFRDGNFQVIAGREEDVPHRGSGIGEWKDLGMLGWGN